MEKIKKIIDEKSFWLLYLYGIASCLSISASTIILIIFLILYLININRNYKLFPKDFFVFIIIYIWKMLTLIFNSLFSYLDRIVNIWDKTPYLFGSAFKFNKEKILRFIEIILWLNLIVIVYALLEKYAGFPVIIKPLFADGVRFKGYFSHPLRFAGYLSLVVLLSFNFATFYSSKFIKFFPFLFLGLFLNASRSYIISVILTILIVSYLESIKTFLKAFFSVTILFGIFLFTFSDVKSRIFTTFYKTCHLKESSQTIVANEASQLIDHSQSSASLRVNYWKAGIEIFSLKPVYGVGDGQISKYLKPYKENGILDNYAHAHNSYITAMAESGIIGLAFFIWIFFYFLKKYLKLALNSTDSFIKTFSFFLFSAFLNLAIGGIFESNFSTFIIWSFLTFMMGIFESYIKNNTQFDNSSIIGPKFYLPHRQSINKSMKIAVVHDWLVTYAGAERVLEQIINLFHQADLFSLIDFLPQEKRFFIKNKKVKTSFLQYFPFVSKKYRSYLPFFPIAIESLDLSGYDLIISVSHAVAKGIKRAKSQKHICICCSPIRYAWDLRKQYLAETGLDKGIKGFMANYLLDRIKAWDIKTLDRVNEFVAISGYISERIRRNYSREAVVIYPPVDVDKFSLQEEKDNFYLTASRMVPYKKIPLIVEAFSNMPDKKLVVIGDGPEFEKVKSKANKNIEILGYQSDEVLRNYLQKAKAFVFAAEEDFGILPVEAQACGTPVIAYGKGGATETVIDGKTGVFFDAQSVESLLEAVNRFEEMSGNFNPWEIRKNAERFSVERFKKEFKSFVSGTF